MTSKHNLKYILFAAGLMMVVSSLACGQVVTTVFMPPVTTIPPTVTATIPPQPVLATATSTLPVVNPGIPTFAFLTSLPIPINTSAQESPSIIVQASPDSSTGWRTYRNERYSFTFEYPAIYDEEAYRDSCGLKEIENGIHLGTQINLLILDSGGMTLADYANNLIQSKGWSVDAQTNELISGGIDALTIQYRFGGTNRFGTVTLVWYKYQIFEFGFTAGGFCDYEPEAYDHMLESFLFFGD
jgi:hypothetical protein